MQLPKKIGVVNSVRGVDPKLKFDNYEGYDTKIQIEHLVYKINEILDFLEKNPALPNETPMNVTIDPQGNLIHEHDWVVIRRIQRKVFRDCRICGEREIRPV
jgi:hypothetical protein